MLVFRAVLAAVLVSVLVPMFFDRSFRSTAPASLAFYAVIVFYGLLMSNGVTWAKRWLPERWPWPFFALQLLLFSAAFVLPIPHDTIWVLAMPVVSLATGTLRIPAVVLVAAGFVAIHAVHLRQVGASWGAVLAMVLSLSVGMLFTSGCTGLAFWANRSREKAERLARELEQANDELRAASERTAALATAQERNRIARDIHDGLGHYLTVVAVQLQAARALLPAQPDRAGEAIGKAERSAREALEAVRRSVGALREPDARPPLHVALEELVRESGLEAGLDCAGEPRPLPEPAEQALFRTVQEALTNVRKHAGPARVAVRLDYLTPARVAVEVSDDGRGRRAASPAGGFGLAGLRERLGTVGGTLAADNRPGGGFLVRAEVPA
jgi:signal transduction histidine kinase